MSTPFVSPVLVGRADQLAALNAALADAGRGRPSAVVIGGEAGIGKSRLVNEFTDGAGRAGARVLTGGCLELGADGLPFAPFTSVLRDLVRDMGVDGVAGLLPGGATRELARLLPEFGEPGGPDDAGEARARLFEQVLILLEQLAERDQVVLVIEDAHWADRSTRDLLSFLIRNQSILDRLLIVVTYRSDELHRAHPLRPMLAELDRVGWVTRIELARLNRADTGDLVARITGREPPDDVLAAIYRRTEGNPLFVEALVGDAELGSGLPESLRDLLIASVRRLPEHTQDVVRVASAGGEHVGHALLVAVIGLDESALASALRPAVSANVLLTGSDSYTFRHNLIREAVHDELLPGERSRLHGRFARAIQADPSLVPPGRAAVEQAYHWYAAHDTGGALVSAWQAAVDSAKSLAYAEQLAMLSRVLELWDQVPDAAERIGTGHVAVLEAGARAADLAGEFDRGITLAHAALKEVDAEAEPVRAALLLEARSHLKSQLGRADYEDDLRQALRLVPVSPPTAARARVLVALADEYNHRYGASDPAQFRAYADEALSVARQAGDGATEAAALVALACGVPVADNWERIQAMLAEARQAAIRARAYMPLLRTAITESDMLEGLGQHEQAAAVAREGIATARDYGLSRTSGAVLAINLAEPLVSLGRWDEAVDVIERALQLAPSRLRRSSLWRLAGEVALDRGDLPAAAEHTASVRAVLDDGRFKDERQPPLARLEADLRLAQGRPADAVATVADALERWALITSSRYAWPLLSAGARACAAAAVVRDKAVPEAAVALRDRLRADAADREATGAAEQAHRLTFTAEMMRADRALAGSGADPGPGEVPGPGDQCAAWDAAARASETLSEPYRLAVALLRAAEAALAAGDHDGGASRLRRAAAVAGRLGAEPLSDDIALLARRARIGLGADSDPGAGAAAPAASGALTERERLGLTAREFEVLRLVAAGRSNPEIASELFISVKTASVHVSNILGKLGVAGRGEAAAMAHRLRLFEVFPESPPVSAAERR
jgi:DNA-binding CsgD family transcriptional regulator/tetratricopeptide (TPR) repeat protein